jgi:RNA polymerase sigma-70 factor (ECF subfamily)
VNRIVEHRIRGLLDHHRAAKRRPPGPPMEAHSGVAPAAHAPGPATAAAGRESGARLLVAMDALADEERNVLLLRFHLGLTLDEAAHALGKSVGATRRLLGRALLDLAQRLEPRA